LAACGSGPKSHAISFVNQSHEKPWSQYRFGKQHLLFEEVESFIASERKHEWTFCD
jgi:hypothetical protein